MKKCQKNIIFLVFFIVAFVCSWSIHAAIPEETEVATATAPVAQEISAETQNQQSPAPTQAALAQPAVVSPPAVATISQAAPVAPPEKQMVETEKAPDVSKPSGMVEISGFKYPVYLFVPNDYKTDRLYPMVTLAPSEAVKARDQIEYLAGLAQRRSIFILAPDVLWPKAGDTPYWLDEWFLSVKKEIIERFPINKKRVYLLGKGTGAQYAAYLATEHPQEFSAVVLLEKAWEGPFAQLIKPRSNAVNQVPFYIAFKAGSEEKERNQIWLEDLQKKGYLLNVTEYQKDEELNELEFKKAFFDWLEDKSQSWAAIVAKSHEGWKGRFKKGVKNFFEV